MADLASVVAATVLSKGAEMLVGGARDGVEALLRLVRERFGRDGRDRRVLLKALENPEDQRCRGELARAIADAMNRDPDFADRLRLQWQAMSAQMVVDHDAVVNRFSGRADKVIQARDIHGDIVM